jgi:hypothetical protein
MFSKLVALSALAAVAVAQSSTIHPSSSSAHCLTSSANSDRAAVSVAECNGSDAQKWAFQNGQLTAWNGAQCLMPVNGQTQDGTGLYTNTCVEGNPAEKWSYTDSKTFVYFLFSPVLFIY